MDSDPLIASTELVAAESADKVICGICRRQFSKYICPTCNVAYCSLACFRSESHSQCSETFYRKEVESGINSEPSKTAEEKLKMMELLKRLEKQSQEDDQNLLETDDDVDEDAAVDLAQRLGDMDINSISPDDLWSMLTPEERKKFMKALDNPSSELAQQLLASETLDSERLEPWWEAPSLNDGTQALPTKQYGVKPEVMPIPSAIPKMLVTGSPLLYNICAMCLAYAYTTRYLSISPLSSLNADNPDFQEARRIISQLAPFVTDRKSKILHSSLDSVITDIWSRFEAATIDNKLIFVLLCDTAQLLRPRVVTDVSPSTSGAEDAKASDDPTRSTLDSHPSLSSLLVLSDLFKLFESRQRRSAERQNHVTMKISFYAAHIMSTPSSILGHVSEKIVARSKILEGRALSTLSNTATDHRPPARSFSGGWMRPEFEKNGKIQPMIRELP
ncbi:hypothetical protein PILCRDRAFT_812311 [Piloderma croceum F 1598]|uniref:HIT-type domain-containing protein n=1 Tax=Piloderma croceum (strain F 1598) TaxID=765440 RepID=A0A0C3BVI6_PILCF|nr:hypothetical protein PILCRDRAFT_812311 [Piloderma croceum F 1598]